MSASNGSYQGVRDTPRPNQHGNDVAQRPHNRSRLSRNAETRINLPSDTETDVTTTAMTAPSGAHLAFPGPPPGADPLPGQLDRWLAARGAELVTIRRH